MVSASLLRGPDEVPGNFAVAASAAVGGAAGLPKSVGNFIVADSGAGPEMVGTFIVSASVPSLGVVVGSFAVAISAAVGGAAGLPKSVGNFIVADCDPASEVVGSFIVSASEPGVVVVGSLAVAESASIVGGAGAPKSVGSFMVAD
jgi:hypothetical protein